MAEQAGTQRRCNDMKIIVKITLLLLSFSVTYAVNSCLDQCELQDGLLSISDCSISDEDIEAGDLDLCFDTVGRENVVTIWMEDNYFTTLPEEAFEGMMALEDLSFAFCNLKSLPEGIFQDLSSLKYMYFNYNELSTLPEGIFQGLTSLEELILGNNYFRTFPDGIFDDLVSLENLWIANNDLISLSDGIFNGLESLVELTITGNSLDCLPMSTATVLKADDGVPDCEISSESSTSTMYTGVSSVRMTLIVGIGIIIGLGLF